MFLMGFCTLHDLAWEFPSLCSKKSSEDYVLAFPIFSSWFMKGWKYHVCKEGKYFLGFSIRFFFIKLLPHFRFIYGSWNGTMNANSVPVLLVISGTLKIYRKWHHSCLVCWRERRFMIFCSKGLWKLNIFNMWLVDSSSHRYSCKGACYSAVKKRKRTQQ